MARWWNGRHAALRTPCFGVRVRVLLCLPMKLRDIIFPERITEDMVIRASKASQPWHVAANLNAMLQFGYCRTCGMCPVGCDREGCKSNVQVEESVVSLV